MVCFFRETSCQFFLLPRRIVYGVMLGLVVLVFGCGSGNPETYPVSGKVAYKGATLQSGMVQLMPDGSGQSATGQIQTDGTFTLGTFEADDGALPGKYKVIVQVFPEGENAGLPGQEFGSAPPPIPLKYMNPATTDLTCEIKPGENTLDFQLQ